MPKLISLIVPFYNEEESVDIFFDTVLPIMKSIEYKYEVICINDGSSDNTLDRLKAIYEIDKNIVIVNFSRNFGKEAALTAGIDYAEGDAVIPMDCDLQDPPLLIPSMIKKWENGYEVVLAKRINRDSDSFLKRVTAKLFYKFHNKISDFPIPENIGDFRLIDRMVVEAIKLLPERRRFMKGIFSWVGFKSCIVEYTREPRAAGMTKFNGWKLWNFAIEGITSFSTIPLRVWTYIGLIVSLISIFYGGFIVVRTLVEGVVTPGYASLFSAILFLGGIQLIGIGVIGEYIGRIYVESKQRPIYIVKDVMKDNKNESK
jgi:glycosyltransferase involved in cell wall biosynthesis